MILKTAKKTVGSIGCELFPKAAYWIPGSDLARAGPCL